MFLPTNMHCAENNVYLTLCLEPAEKVASVENASAVFSLTLVKKRADASIH